MNCPISVIRLVFSITITDSDIVNDDTRPKQPKFAELEVDETILSGRSLSRLINRRYVVNGIRYRKILCSLTFSMLN